MRLLVHIEYLSTRQAKTLATSIIDLSHRLFFALLDIAIFSEQVYMKEPGLTQAKLEDRWLGPWTWLGKTDMGDKHMCCKSDGKSISMGRSIRRLPESGRWDKEKVMRIEITPWEPKVTDASFTEPRRR